MKAYYIVHLTGGQSVKVECDEDMCDTIYDCLAARAGVMSFDNGSFRSEHVAGLEYVDSHK